MLAIMADYTGLTQCELLALQNESLKKFLENGMTDYKRMSLDQQIAFEVCYAQLHAPSIYLNNGKSNIKKILQNHFQAYSKKFWQLHS